MGSSLTDSLDGYNGYLARHRGSGCAGGLRPRALTHNLAGDTPIPQRRARARALGREVARLGARSRWWGGLDLVRGGRLHTSPSGRGNKLLLEQRAQAAQPTTGAQQYTSGSSAQATVPTGDSGGERGHYEPGWEAYRFKVATRTRLKNPRLLPKWSMPVAGWREQAMSTWKSSLREETQKTQRKVASSKAARGYGAVNASPEAQRSLLSDVLVAVNMKIDSGTTDTLDTVRSTFQSATF